MGGSNWNGKQNVTNGCKGQVWTLNGMFPNFWRAHMI